MLFTVGTLDKPDCYDPGNIDVVTLATGERHVLIKGAAMARGCGVGRVIYSKSTSLYSVAIDPDRLQVTGAPVEIVQGVERDASTGAAHFDCSDDGTLAYVPGSAIGDLRRLAWANRQGHIEPLPLAADRCRTRACRRTASMWPCYRVRAARGTSGSTTPSAARSPASVSTARARRPVVTRRPLRLFTTLDASGRTAHRSSQTCRRQPRRGNRSPARQASLHFVGGRSERHGRTGHHRHRLGSRRRATCAAGAGR